jgi:protein TonB
MPGLGLCDMQRRDTKTQQRTGTWEQWWPRLVSAALSITVHAALLALALAVIAPRHQSEPIIRLTLVAGGGDGTEPGGSEAAEVATARNQPAPQPVLQPPSARPVERPPRVEPSTRWQPKQPPVVPAPVAKASAPAAESAEGAADGETVAGAGSGRGAGLGKGDGTGSGGGSGGGKGGGTGSGTDQRAHCVYCPEPQYPLLARRRGWQGTVQVGLRVLADGTVEDANLRQSSGHGVLDDAAVRVARKSRFTPPPSLGLVAPLQGRIEYRFQLSKAR